MQEQGDFNFHGIDWNGPISEENDSAVDVPEIEIPLLEEELDELQSIFSPNTRSDNFGIDIYIRVLERVNNVIRS